MSRRALIFGLPRRLARESAAELAVATSPRSVEPKLHQTELQPHSQAGIADLLQQLDVRARSSEGAPGAPAGAGRQEVGDGED